MARREYKGAATPTTLAATITNSATSLTITDATNWPTGSFSLVIDPGLAGEEKVLATSRTGTTVTLTTRGYDNTSASSHVSGAVIYPVPTAIDFDEANAHVNASTGVHSVTGSVVGTTDTQTLTNKSLSDSTTSIIDVTDGTKVVKFDVNGTTGVTGTIATNFTTAKTVTLPDATDTLVGKATTDTLTKKTLTSPRETTTVSATAATGTINFDVLTQAVLIYTTNASATWVLNVRGDGSTSLNTVMATGETQTIAFIAAQGSTAYYPTSLTIDGTTVTPKWQGGTAPAAGNASSDDAYTYAITKTGSATFRVYASQTKFA